MQVNLVLFKPNGQRVDVPVKASKLVIGRRQDCGLRVPLEGVSRQHCQIQLADKAVAVRDLDSSNGTYVNGQRVNQQALSAGDRLQVGPVTFTVQIDGEPTEVRPVAVRAAKAAEKSAAPAPKAPKVAKSAKKDPAKSKAASEEELALELIGEFNTDNDDEDDILEDIDFEEESDKTQ